MKYRIRNLTYSPLRVVIDGKDIRFNPRKYTILDKIDEGVLSLVKKGLIKIREIK
jgi:hypothetical protein